MMFNPTSYETLTVQNFDLESALFADSQNPMETQDFDLSNFIPPPPSAMLPSVSPATPLTDGSSSSPASPQSPSTPPLPTTVTEAMQQQSQQACVQLQLNSCPPAELKFAEGQMEKVFTRLAVRAGYATMTPEIRAIMTKMVQFYAPLIQQYGNHLLGIQLLFSSKITRI